MTVQGFGKPAVAPLSEYARFILIQRRIELVSDLRNAEIDVEEHNASARRRLDAAQRLQKQIDDLDRDLVKETAG